MNSILFQTETEVRNDGLNFLLFLEAPGKKSDHMCHNLKQNEALSAVYFIEGLSYTK